MRNRNTSAFTLIELLVVIAIIGILAGIAAPLLNTFRPNPSAVATRALLDAVSRARQLAISQHTTVYMVFVPTNFWADPSYPPQSLAVEFNKGTNLYDKQLIGYNFVTLRSVGDQPGQPHARYLSSWKTLPEGAFIPVQKFGPRTQYLNIYSNDTALAFQAYGFNVTNGIPFPAEDTPPSANPSKPFASVPYLGFNYLGQLVSGQNELIPVTRGNVLHARDRATKIGLQQLPSVLESPVGNGATNSYNVVAIDWLTGRARVERQKVQ
jgi:prepilin-type N-terminal cleavage/methylation domain-containing protein